LLAAPWHPPFQIIKYTCDVVLELPCTSCKDSEKKLGRFAGMLSWNPYNPLDEVTPHTLEEVAVLKNTALFKKRGIHYHPSERDNL
jgi:hypothetical protein